MAAALAQMTALSGQLNEALTRTSHADVERRQALALAAAAQTGAHADPLGGLVDSKGIGQPWKYGNKKEQDFQEWTAKFVLFISAKYGPEMKKVLDWSKKQWKAIVRQAFTAQQVRYEREFGHLADAIDQIENLDRKLAGTYLYMMTFTTDEANKIVRNSEDRPLEAWRKLHSLVDPASAVKRMSIYNKIAQPAKVTDVKDLARALENWLSDKREYEKLEDEAGNPFRLSADAGLSAMYSMLPKSLEDTVMFQKEAFSRWEDMFDRLASFSSSKVSFNMAKQTASDNKMELDALNKGGKGGKGKCFQCGQPGHQQR